MIRIVLVEPSHPGNIGARARAMKNMALAELVLVRPKLFPHPDAVARASGADDVLAQARVVDTLAQGIAGCGFIAAAAGGNLASSQAGSECGGGVQGNILPAASLRARATAPIVGQFMRP